MNPLLRLADRATAAFCRAPCWRGECRVWGQTMAGVTFDRWLYLRLHRFSRFGRAERESLGRLVRPGMTVVDVGSNLGLYTVLLSRLVGPTGQVVAFEPDPALFALLERNCARNGCGNVRSRRVALGSGRARLAFSQLLVNAGDNHLGDAAGRPFRRSVEVEVQPLDEAAPSLAPDLVKIDVQGWELHVLRGMTGMLDRNPHVALYLELWPGGLHRAGDSPDELVAFLLRHGFTLHRADSLARLDPASLAGITQRLTGLRHIDLYAVRR